MGKNREAAETDRFNGHPSFHAGSTRPVTTAELGARVRQSRAKLTDPNDPGAKGRVARWLGRSERELGKKRKGLESKGRGRQAESRPGSAASI